MILVGFVRDCNLITLHRINSLMHALNLYWFLLPYLYKAPPKFILAFAARVYITMSTDQIPPKMSLHMSVDCKLATSFYNQIFDSVKGRRIIINIRQEKLQRLHLSIRMMASLSDNHINYAHCFVSTNDSVCCLLLSIRPCKSISNDCMS